MQRHIDFKMYPQHEQCPVFRRKPPMLARDDKPGAQGVDVTAPCDRQKFSKFDDFLKISFKNDVALKHVFTKYQSRKIIESVDQQSPRGEKK